MKTIITLIALLGIGFQAMAHNDKANLAKIAVENVTNVAAVGPKKVMTVKNAAGEIIMMSRYINDTDLPVALVNNLMKKLPNEVFTSILEVTAQGEKTFVITLESATGFKVLKCNTDGNYEITIQFSKA
ncbi:hypothetical protein LX64_04393 [Chitinophaga skermanii]|uniref:PepSY-like beta-lactamase-inhibitor n=1 Tax=Chitinophaga skermanii TaxID=331697 RepID=A0A327Q6D4_9BACT|nr:hypothetical protein [Chitinophaga skermanii]RAI99840.1 hypothetical protein LX64_04393 [Chitinophaga skermanii]